MFNQSSGQVFREWTLPRQALVAGQPDHDWSRRCCYPRITPRGAQGPRPLVDMVTNVVANNIGHVTEQHLEAMPPRLRWRVWRFLEARGLCLHAWKLFSKSLLTDDDEKTLGLYRYRQHICKPHRALPCYTQPLTSPTFDFITHLVISGGCEFSTNEMLSLTDIRNLGVLEIIQPADDMRSTFPEITDRLVRGWAEKENAFPLLRVLRIWGDQTTTQESLRWISKFPSLALYDVMGSREDWKRPHDYATDHGWELAEPASRMEDSLLRYLMLFAPGEDTQVKRPRDLARTIDPDLSSLCSDSRCAVKFVDYDQAPDLLDYLTDTAKLQTTPGELDIVSRETRSCQGAVFEAWAFWLYSFIGQLSHDRDMEACGARPATQAVAGPFVLPSKPLACLFLGHSGRGGISSKPSYVSRGLFATKRFTFTRLSVVDGTHPCDAESGKETEPDLEASGSTNSGMNFRRQKRKRIDDVLNSFVG